MQRLDAGTESLVPVSSSSSSSSPPSVDGIGVEANADRLDALEYGDMHLLRRVAGSGESVSVVVMLACRGRLALLGWSFALCEAADS